MKLVCKCGNVVLGQEGEVSIVTPQAGTMEIICTVCNTVPFILNNFIFVMESLTEDSTLSPLPHLMLIKRQQVTCGNLHPGYVSDGQVAINLVAAPDQKEAWDVTCCRCKHVFSRGPVGYKVSVESIDSSVAELQKWLLPDQLPSL